MVIAFPPKSCCNVSPWACFSVVIPFPALRKNSMISFSFILVSPTATQVGYKEKNRPLFSFLPTRFSVITWSQGRISLLQSCLQTLNSDLQSGLVPIPPPRIRIAPEGSWNLPTSVPPAYPICSSRQLHTTVRLFVIKAQLFASTVSYHK